MCFGTKAPSSRGSSGLETSIRRSPPEAVRQQRERARETQRRGRPGRFEAAERLRPRGRREIDAAQAAIAIGDPGDVVARRDGERRAARGGHAERVRICGIRDVDQMNPGEAIGDEHARAGNGDSDREVGCVDDGERDGLLGLRDVEDAQAR